MQRTKLTRHISVIDFQKFYWLKEELVVFCRQNGLCTTGSKIEIANRIEHFLMIGNFSPVDISTKRRNSYSRLPEKLGRDTIVGINWRCSEQLRAFFVQELGPRFHFNGAMRAFIKNGVGKTLQDGINVWLANRESPQCETVIAPQFEYNRHMREYFKSHSGKTIQDAIASWKEKKAQRNNNAA